MVVVVWLKVKGMKGGDEQRGNENHIQVARIRTLTGNIRSIGLTHATIKNLIWAARRGNGTICIQ
jgi:hypothetical protein